MFGYLKPCKPYLLVKDYELYKSVYCGLCKRLSEEYGVLAKMVLSYDCTCYALLAMGLNGRCEGVQKKHCTCNPLKKCLYCVGGNDELSLASAITVVTVYYKLEDDIKDSSFIKGLPSRFLKIFASSWRKKSLKKYPQVDKIVGELNNNQYKAEQKENPTIDESAEPTAIMMKRLMLLLAKTDVEKAVYGEFGYFLGKWVYLMDAADDYEKDIKKNNFNPFVHSLKEKNLTQQQRSEYMNSVLNITASRVVSAFNLMNVQSFTAIADNLVNMGLGEMQKKIIFDKYIDKSKKEIEGKERK